MTMTSTTPTSNETASCGLPDLVRPQFFPGQRLTDRDLTAIVEWVRARFRLDHLHGSWGVVCGLDVTAEAATSGQSPAVTVSPGFAVDACGNPLVARETLVKELPRVGQRSAGKCPLPGNPQDSKATLTVGPYENQLQSRWAVFDLLLCPAETVAESVAAGCHPDGRTCKTTRTSEGATLEWARVPWEELTPSKEDGSKAESQDPGYQLLKRFAAKKLVNQEVFDGTKAATEAEAESIWKWAVQEVGTNPTPLQPLPNWSVAEQKKALMNPIKLAQVLFWLADAARHYVTDCPEECGNDCETSVPLARVWTEIDGSFYAIRFIDVASPVRRSYGPDDDGLNPLKYVGRPWEEVRVALGQRGVAATLEPFPLTSGAKLLDLYKAEKPLVPGEPVTALVISVATGTSLQPLAGRVVAFRPKLSEVVVDRQLTTIVPKLCFADAKTETESFVFSNDSKLEAITKASKELPVGGWVCVSVSLKPLNLTTGIPYAIFYFDELTRQVNSVGITASEEMVVATVRIRSQEQTPVQVTLLAEETIGSPRRVIAATAILTLPDENGGQTPATVTITDLPSCNIDPVAKMDATHTQVIRLGSDGEVLIPFNVTVKNLPPNRGSVDLFYSTTKPDNPDTKNGSQNISFDSTKVGDPTIGTGAIPVPKAENLFVWLRNGKDIFLRSFNDPVVETKDGKVFFDRHSSAIKPYPIRTINMAVTVTNGAANIATLTLTNNEGKAITLTSVTATQLVEKPKELSPEFTPKTIETGKTASSPDLVATDTKSKWRIVVSFTIGTGTETEALTAAIDVTPTTPTP